MKLEWLLMGLLLILWVIIASTLLTEESKVGHGFGHPSYEKMQRGGSGQERHGPILWLGWSFGVVQMAMFVGCLAFGARRKERLGRVKWALLAGLLLYAGVFTAIVLTYRRGLQSADPQFLLGFPLPTTLFLLGLWAAPLCFVLLYVVIFDNWIYTSEDEKAFQQLVEENRRRRENSE